MAKFKCNLKRYRQLANLTQEELAQIVKVRRETIQRLEAGKYNPSLKLAIDIQELCEPLLRISSFSTRKQIASTKSSCVHFSLMMFRKAS